MPIGFSIHTTRVFEKVTLQIIFLKKELFQLLLFVLDRKGEYIVHYEHHLSHTLMSGSSSHSSISAAYKS